MSEKLTLTSINLSLICCLIQFTLTFNLLLEDNVSG